MCKWQTVVKGISENSHIFSNFNKRYILFLILFWGFRRRRKDLITSALTGVTHDA